MIASSAALSSSAGGLLGAFLVLWATGHVLHKAVLRRCQHCADGGNQTQVCVVCKAWRCVCAVVVAFEWKHCKPRGHGVVRPAELQTLRRTSAR